MLKALDQDFKGIITITGAMRSGKSQLAEFLIKEQESITYIATSEPRKDDKDWEKRIYYHKIRRPEGWKLIEYPLDICEEIESLGENKSILIDSLGGLVEQHLKDNEAQWEQFVEAFLECLKKSNCGIFVVIEEIGWGVVPSTAIGHLFRERLSNLSSILVRHSTRKWLAINGSAIDLDIIGYRIP